MALRGTLTHRKTRRLAAILKIDPCFALGILESLWHLTAEQAPQGDIGHMTNQDIADEIFYSKNPDTLINALTDVGYLDKCEEHRLVVHDWESHADQSIKRKLERHNKTFIKPCLVMASQQLAMKSTVSVSGTGSGSGLKEEEKHEKGKPKKTGNGKETTWEESPVYEFEKFREGLKDWSEEKVRHWHTVFSESEPGKYRYNDWCKAAHRWNRREPFKESQSTSKAIKSIKEIWEKPDAKRSKDSI